MSSNETAERDEGMIQRMTGIADFCHRGDVDVRPLRDTIEPFVAQTEALRKAADSAGMNQRRRRVLGDALSRSIREGLE